MFGIGQELTRIVALGKSLQVVSWIVGDQRAMAWNDGVTSIMVDQLNMPVDWHATSLPSCICDQPYGWHAC